MKFRNLFVLSCSAFALLALTACQPASSSSANNTPPMSVSKQMKMKERAQMLADKMQQNPCYVQIFEDENYQGDYDVIFGPMTSTDMKNLSGSNLSDWSDEIESLKVSPKATVTVWQDPDYNEAVQTLTSGTEKTNLKGDPNFADEISSMKITCES
jgi:Beta/Gamma crystallin